MKTLLALLLLIPSLSWGEEIKLICNYTKEVYRIEGETQDSIFLDTKKKYIFIFDSNNKLLTKYSDYGNRKYELDEEFSDEATYHFWPEGYSENEDYSEIIKLNRFTLEIRGSKEINDDSSSMYSMNCSITNQLL